MGCLQDEARVNCHASHEPRQLFDERASENAVLGIVQFVPVTSNIAAIIRFVGHVDSNIVATIETSSPCRGVLESLSSTCGPQEEVHNNPSANNEGPKHDSPAENLVTLPENPERVVGVTAKFSRILKCKPFPRIVVF